MGVRQENLKSIVFDKYQKFNHPKITEAEIINSRYYNEIQNIYNNLGGKLDPLPLRYGPWDISTQNFILELDEERHFNRYRLLTLDSKIYDNLSLFSVSNYKSYCINKEDKCKKTASWGKNWKNNSTEKMFPISDINGNLENNGSSRWRQRAYYDFLKDFTSKIKSIPIYRISIYDIFNGKSVNDLLIQNNYSEIDRLIQTRVSTGANTA